MGKVIIPDDKKTNAITFDDFTEGDYIAIITEKDHGHYYKHYYKIYTLNEFYKSRKYDEPLINPATNKVIAPNKRSRRPNYGFIVQRATVAASPQTGGAKKKLRKTRKSKKSKKMRKSRRN